MGADEIKRRVAVRRRSVLLGAGTVGVAAAAGCGSSGSGNGGGTADRGVASAGASLVADTTDIPVGGGKIFADQKIVVTQPTAGAFKAFTAICTHQGCTLGSVASGLIMCPCHGSEYSIVDGSVKRGPAPSPLAAKQLTVVGTKITVNG